MNNAAYGKTRKNLRNKIGVKLAGNRKRLFTMDIKTKLHVALNI